MNAIHIFRAGCYTAMAGQEVCLSRQDLEAAAAAYSPAISRAPLVLGHPDAADPAYGWVTSLRVEGGELTALVDQVSEDLKGWVRAGRYGKVSASFWPPNHPGNPSPGSWYLRHVGFLGAATPAVRGLTPPEFTEHFPVPQGCCVQQERMILFERARSFQKERYPSLSFAHAVQAIEAGDTGAAKWDSNPNVRAQFASRDAYVEFCYDCTLGLVPDGCQGPSR